RPGARTCYARHGRSCNKSANLARGCRRRMRRDLRGERIRLVFQAFLCASEISQQAKKRIRADEISGENTFELVQATHASAPAAWAPEKSKKRSNKPRRPLRTPSSSLLLSVLFRLSGALSASAVIYS